MTCSELAARENKRLIKVLAWCLNRKDRHGAGLVPPSYSYPNYQMLVFPFLGTWKRQLFGHH